MCLSTEQFPCFCALKKDSYLADKTVDRLMLSLFRLNALFLENPNLEVTGTPKRAFVYA